MYKIHPCVRIKERWATMATSQLNKTPLLQNSKQRLISHRGISSQLTVQNIVDTGVLLIRTANQLVKEAVQARICVILRRCKEATASFSLGETTIRDN